MVGLLHWWSPWKKCRPCRLVSQLNLQKIFHLIGHQVLHHLVKALRVQYWALISVEISAETNKALVSKSMTSKRAKRLVGMVVSTENSDIFFIEGHIARTSSFMDSMPTRATACKQKLTQSSLRSLSAPMNWDESLFWNRFDASSIIKKIAGFATAVMKVVFWEEPQEVSCWCYFLAFLERKPFIISNHGQPEFLSSLRTINISEYRYIICRNHAFPNDYEATAAQQKQVVDFPLWRCPHIRQNLRPIRAVPSVSTAYHQFYVVVGILHWPLRKCGVLCQKVWGPMLKCNVHKM